ncbi:MAG: hypothetical protein IGS23_05585 [Rivularia sp. T60_A2020_040]|nr:hypothetical protein [Rivularia sp. T60_A2020_040]
MFVLNHSQTSYSYLLIPTYIAFAQIIVLAGLSLIFPINRPPGYRQTYIGLEILIIMIARAVGIGFNIVLYLVIAKSCFFLRRKQVIFMPIISGILWNLLLALSIPKI